MSSQGGVPQENVPRGSVRRGSVSRAFVLGEVSGRETVLQSN